MNTITNRLKALLSKKVGIKLNRTEAENCETVLFSRMDSLGIENPSEYLHMLTSSEEELQIFIEEVVNLETYFFRDEKLFYFLAEIVQKRKKQSDHPLTILFIPCSTGEEPYSLLMALKERNVPLESVEIDAVDVSVKALQVAEKGGYGSNSFRGRKLTYRDKYFDLKNGQYWIHKDFLNRVNFLRANLAADNLLLPHKKYDVIVCRNLLFYFSDEAQKVAFDHFSHLLSTEGILILTPAEWEIGHKFGYYPQYTNNNLVYFTKGEPQRCRERKKNETSPSKPVRKQRQITPLSDFETHKEELSLEKARKFADVADYQEAASICIDYLDKHRTSADAYYLLGVIQHAQGNDEKAEQYFNKTIYLNPKHHQALVYLTLLSENKNEPDQAQMFRKRAKRCQ